MGDFIELGLEGADKLIDKHFHKVPDKFVDPETYKRPLRKGSRASTDSQDRSDDRYQDSKERHHHHRHHSPQSNTRMDERYRRDANSSPYLQDGPYITPPLYSSQPPRQRPEYVPTPPPSGSIHTYERERYSSPPRRPLGRRRSSSYHGPRDDHFYSSSSDDDRQLTVRDSRRRAGSHNGVSEKVRDKAERYEVKNEIRNQFTTSKEGIAGGVVGALVGGWAAHKALESRGKDHGNADKALTLLGAAVGGLAVNSIVDKLEDRRVEGRERQERWEEKWEGKSEGRKRRERARSRGSRYDSDDDGYYR